MFKLFISDSAPGESASVVRVHLTISRLDAHVQTGGPNCVVGGPTALTDTAITTLA